MPFAAAAGAIASAYIAKESAEDSAEAVSQASNSTISENRRQFDLTRGDTAPYRQAGESALFRLQDLFGLQRPQPVAQPETQQVDRNLQSRDDQFERMFNSWRKQVGDSGQGGESAPSFFGLESMPQDRRLEAMRKMRPDLWEMAQMAYPSQGTNMANSPGQASNIAPSMKDDPSRMRAFSGTPGAPGSTTGSSPMDPTSILQNTPGYQFRLGESEKAMERMQASKGYSMTPRAAKEVGRYASDYASGEFGNLVESMFRLSGLGGNAVNTSASSGANSANQIGQAYANQGMAGANAAMTYGSGLNNAIQGGLSNYTTLQEYNRQRRVNENRDNPGYSYGV